LDLILCHSTFCYLSSSWRHCLHINFFFLFWGMNSISFDLGHGETESTWNDSHYLIQALDGRKCWMWSSWWNGNWQRKPKYSVRPHPSATLSTTDPVWPDLCPNPSRHDGKPVTNRFSCGMASEIWTYFWCINVDNLLISMKLL
jgi:hypothetical protein